MSLYTKALKHIDMNRVKELREEKIKRKKNADEIREQIREELRNINSPEFSNWREGIAEGMTSSGMFNTTLPAQGDVDLEDINNNGSSVGSNPDFSQNGNTYTFGSVTDAARGSSISMNSIDATKYDTISFNFSAGTIDTFYMITGAPAPFGANSQYNLSSGSGRKTITLKAGDRLSKLAFAFQVERGGTDNLPIGTNIITNLSFQRRTPMNVFVSLDSPEATNFIRTDPTMQGLSAEDRKKKLIDMLDAGDEYLLKYLGIIGSKARPSDTTMPDSWEQASGNPDTGGQPGYHSPGSTSPSGAAASDKNMTWDKHMKMYVPNIGPGDLLKKADAGSKDYGNVAANQGPSSPVKNYDGKIMPNPGAGKPGKVRLKPQYLPKASKKQPVVAHHEPKGEVLSEKKKLKSPKDITSKIPGYYDGKPAPIGFPMQEPPKMVNGFHPDLVDGKKIANRFNRLDPQSAKAMPPTGNPHIDKKVRAAAKKPK